jgi:hypothetical protein
MQEGQGENRYTGQTFTQVNREFKQEERDFE